VVSHGVRRDSVTARSLWGFLKQRATLPEMGWIEGILGIAGGGLSIWLWWLNNRAATKEEIKDQNAADNHERTADYIDDQLR